VEYIIFNFKLWQHIEERSIQEKTKKNKTRLELIILNRSVNTPFFGAIILQIDKLYT